MWRSKSKKRKEATRALHVARIAKSCEYIAMNLSKYPPMVRGAEYEDGYLCIKIKALIYDRIVVVTVRGRTVLEYYICGRDPGKEIESYKPGEWEQKLPELKARAIAKNTV